VSINSAVDADALPVPAPLPQFSAPASDRAEASRQTFDQAPVDARSAVSTDTISELAASLSRTTGHSAPHLPPKSQFAVIPTPIGDVAVLLAPAMAGDAPSVMVACVDPEVAAPVSLPPPQIPGVETLDALAVLAPPSPAFATIAAAAATVDPSAFSASSANVYPIFIWDLPSLPSAALSNRSSSQPRQPVVSPPRTLNIHSQPASHILLGECEASAANPRPWRWGASISAHSDDALVLALWDVPTASLATSASFPTSFTASAATVLAVESSPFATDVVLLASLVQTAGKDSPSTPTFQLVLWKYAVGDAAASVCASGELPLRAGCGHPGPVRASLRWADAGTVLAAVDGGCIAYNLNTGKVATLAISCQ
jgi:hypothetical protein